MKITTLIALWISFALTLCQGFNVIVVKPPLYPLLVERQKNQQQTRPFHYAAYGSHNSRCPYPYQQTLLSSSSSSPDKHEDDASVEKEEETKKLSILQTIKKSIGLSKSKKKEDKKKDDDALTFKQRLAKMGLAAVLSYGMVSNVSYSISVSLAWYIFSSRTGLSPLAKGQWKPFLAVYAGFFVFNNIIRPARLALSVAVSVKLEDFVNWIQKRFGVKKAMAYTLCVVFVNVIGTTTLMCAGIFLASILAGVPVFPKA